MLKKHYLKHGMTGTKFYLKWNHIKSRCYREKNKDYIHYGGRGIRCEWNDFLYFKKDMYESYLRHVEKYGEKNTEIDRIDNNKNYCKKNCRWVTRKENVRNRRVSTFYFFNGENKNIYDLADKFKIKPKTVISRLKSGWILKKALFVPTNSERKNEIKIKFNGKIKNITEWSKEKNITHQAMSRRIKKFGINNALIMKKAKNNGKFISEKFLYKNKKYTLKELENKFGIKSNTLSNRIKNLNWSIKQAVETPTIKK